ncbi:hypothetical protein LAZ67_17003025 [Cordylochernes scorpioides]|uniref:Uncharacterized protein n=1 Tax=Cordylochernes scorpioides TaxID=51811 RepID=A0ABY6LED6_9ARAC|nr:hypothetical protein LAZ67_17003025 [Cordylochernes scorpioides]
MENSVQVPKFDGKNFASWKFRIVSILEGKELDDLLEGDPPEDEVKFKEWKKKDAQAKGIITCAMTDSLVALILNCKTSKDIWIALHERYEGDKKKRIIEARNDVSRLTMKKEENWEEYLYRAEKLLEQARNLGAEIEDQEFTTSVIRGLPQKYNLVALQLNCQMKPGHKAIGSFLYGKLSETIYMTQPPGYQDDKKKTSKKLFLIVLFLAIAAAEEEFICPRNYCDTVKCEDLTCEGEHVILVPQATFCGCCSRCIRLLQEGDHCLNYSGVPLEAVCDMGLKCHEKDNVCVRNNQ